MRAYPLQSMDFEDAMKLQFKVIDCITKEFQGHDFLNRGDLGVVQGLNKPVTTHKAEKVVADIFDAEACVCERGRKRCDSIRPSHDAESGRKNFGSSGANLQHNSHVL